MEKQALEEFLATEGFTQTDAELLTPLLTRPPAPTMRSDHQAQTLAAMAALLPQRKTRLERLRELYPVALMASQVTILRSETWFASALVLTLGLLVTLIAPPGDTLVFSALAPIVAAAGVAMIYGNVPQAMLEIEDATRASGIFLLLARLTLVFGYNLGLGLAGSLILVACHSELTLLPLVMGWLAPMTFLCGLAFCLSIQTADPLLAASSSFLFWLVSLVLRRAVSGSVLPWFSGPSLHLALMLSGLLLVIVTVWRLKINNRQERNFR